ncbi:probable tRNA (uracil-O(2)-)-methyltransferase [Hypomesus transpacificus]|uniref:probable tRNA (uracil-O(2)-)-methyltransferase n=1 Tax=Hypomesus transpacificus TaxID=137520 RepID=UPI001F073C4E|nr:probable tRNA (uracil-O(2)-)-methyltransferase [Hypomesus transpacificus]
MPTLFELKFPDQCKTLPEGFWSAVEVWIKKPHVVNKRLCGVKETERKDVDLTELAPILQGQEKDTTESNDVFTFLRTSDSEFESGKEGQWSYSVRTIIPKVNCYGTTAHKEIILRDFDTQRVTFIPTEEDTEGQVSHRKSNIYQLQLLAPSSNEWVVRLHILRPEEWFSDGVAYPKLPWLSTELLPRLVRWATESRTSEFKSTLSLLPVEKYSYVYQQLKDKYRDMVKVWPEVTNPEKFVYEDVAIATYLLVLWGEERSEKGLTDKQSFVDLGCGNGLLVHILTNEGHPGKGIDVRRRKIWDMYGPQTLLEETAITPGDSFLFPSTDWLIGNHSDELTPWIPVMAARSSYSCRYFVLPCCFFDFYGKYQRRQCKKSQYKEYIDFITEVSTACGFITQEDCLRIPSTKRVCLVGKSRTYERSDEHQAEEHRTLYIQSRQARSGTLGQGSNARGEMENGHDDSEACRSHDNDWGSGFQPRERVETVRNCAALPRDFIDGVVLRVANALLGLTKDEDGGVPVAWNRGGSLSVRGVAEMLEQETLQVLKKECGGLQTLLRNNHQVFRVEGGMVHIRDWRTQTYRPRGHGTPADAKRKPMPPGALKTRACWFHKHHPQGCPRLAEECAFAHGLDDLRASTRPLKKLKTFAC